jgi:hypothetical protein
MEGTSLVRFDVSNFESLRNACSVYHGAHTRDPLILVFQTPGGVLHRFIVNEYGIEKQMCTNTGAAVDDV